MLFPCHDDASTVGLEPVRPMKKYVDEATCMLQKEPEHLVEKDIDGVI
jgi:hypothetical protein